MKSSSWTWWFSQSPIFGFVWIGWSSFFGHNYADSLSLFLIPLSTPAHACAPLQRHPYAHPCVAAPLSCPFVCSSHPSFALPSMTWWLDDKLLNLVHSGTLRRHLHSSYPASLVSLFPRPSCLRCLQVGLGWVFLQFFAILKLGPWKLNCPMKCGVWNSQKKSVATGCNRLYKHYKPHIS